MNDKKTRLAGLLLLAIAISPASASTVQVTVTDGNQAVADAVVYLLPANGTPPPAADPAGIMDQRNAQFMPHVLAVRKGAAVQFPNSDNIRHHVYSFSPAKAFQLRLYSGTDAEPVVFNQTGPVVLGCNIHDWMLGYIYVVDTPWFAKTGDTGQVNLSNIPAGDYHLLIWHPRLSDINQPVSHTVTVAANKNLEKHITLELEPAVQRNRGTRPATDSLRSRRRNDD
ncbi:MAG TPA: methylamine utilization protein [Gammaproteobacteria bacterium]|nr:methylamine utilization protein [Gammaproteobacteria bacterium]